MELHALYEDVLGRQGSEYLILGGLKSRARKQR
jgi:hypothetical protein